MATPQTGAPDWVAEQETPWLTVNQAQRIWDAYASRSIVEDRDLTAPPGSCADGDRFLIDGTGTGDWDGHDGELAIAFGANASNGWVFAIVEREGVQLFIRDESLLVQWNGSAWVASEGVTALAQMSDVVLEDPQDSDILVYDASGGIWYNAPYPGGGGGGGAAVVQTEAGDYTLAPGDSTNFIRLTSSSPKLVNIDAEATTPLPANGEWHIRNAGAGDATITPAGGVTVNPPTGGTLIVPEGGTVTLKRAAADVFDLFGAVTAV